MGFFLKLPPLYQGVEKVTKKDILRDRRSVMLAHTDIQRKIRKNKEDSRLRQNNTSMSMAFFLFLGFSTPCYGCSLLDSALPDGRIAARMETSDHKDCLI